MSEYKYTSRIKLPSGKYKYIRANTKKELEQKRLQVQLELRTGVDMSDKTTFEDFYKMWFRTYKTGKVKPQSENIIKCRLEKNVIPYIGKMQLKKITPMVMAGVFSKMDDRGLAQSTQKFIYHDCSQIFEVALDNGLISRSPMTKSVQVGGRKSAKKEALSEEDVKILLDYLQSDPMIYNMAKFDLATGLRLGELFALRWSDIDMDAQTVHVHATAVYSTDINTYQENTKTAAGNRTIPFNTETKQVLLQMKLLRNGIYVFHNDGKLGDALYARKVRYILSKAPTSVHVTPHILRHTCITNWIIAGVPVVVAQHLAGHANSSMTLDVYTSYTQQDHLKIAAEIISKSATKVQPEGSHEFTQIHINEIPESVGITG